MGVDVSEILTIVKLQMRTLNKKSFDLPHYEVYMQMIKNLNLLYLCFLLPFLCFYWMGCSDKDGTQEGVNRRKVPVKIYKVSRGQITSYLNVSGTTLPIEKAKVGAKVEGTIEEILVDEGDCIKKGQVLIRLDPKDFLLDIDRAKASLKTAQAELEKAKHDLEQKSEDWRRLSALYERKAIAKHRYDSMRAAFSIAQAKVKSCQSQIKEREAELKLAEKRYKDSVVEAPFDGVVTKKLLNEGEVSSLWAYNWEVLEIMNLSKIKVECEVSEKWKARLREGMETVITVDAYPEEKFKGKITTINPLVDPQQRTFRVKIRIPNPERRLTAGMFARIKMVLEVREGVLIIPEKEIVERPDGHFIFVVQDGVVKRRKISLGINEGEWVEVTEGLKEGEMIVIEGSHRLQDGYQVETLL